MTYFLPLFLPTFKDATHRFLARCVTSQRYAGNVRPVERSTKLCVHASVRCGSLCSWRHFASQSLTASGRYLSLATNHLTTVPPPRPRKARRSRAIVMSHALRGRTMRREIGPACGISNGSIRPAKPERRHGYQDSGGQCHDGDIESQVPADQPRFPSRIRQRGR